MTACRPGGPATRACRSRCGWCTVALGPAPGGGGDGAAAGGRHERPWAAARMVLGSTSRAVVRHSPCPVMVVPREAHVLDLEAQETAQPVVDAAVTAPASGGLRRHDRSELW